MDRSRQFRSVWALAVCLVLGIAGCELAGFPLSPTETGASNKGNKGNAAKAVDLAPGRISLEPGQSQRMVATVDGKPAKANSVRWSTTNTAIATVNGQGDVRGVAPGTANILARVEGNTYTADVVVAAPVAAVPVALTITPAPVLLTGPGDSTQLSARATDANGGIVDGCHFSWVSHAPHIVEMRSTGRVVAKGFGIALISVAACGLDASLSVSVNEPTSVTVAGVTVASVTVDPSATSVTVGATQQLSATAWDANGIPVAGKTFSWSSSNPAVASVSASGLVSALSGGTVTITGSVDGKSGTGSVTVTASAAPAGPTPGSNEPLGMALVTHNRGSGLPEPGWWIWDPGGDLSLVTDAFAPVPTSRVIRYRYPRGLTGGHGPGFMGHGSDWQGDPGNLRAGGQPVREFYLSFWFRLDPNWQTPGSGQSKLYYVYAMDSVGDRHHVYPVIEGNGTTGPIRVAFHNAVGQTEMRIDPNVSNPIIERGRWYRLEIHARNATATGANDGFLRWWINGALAGNHVGIPRPAIAWTELHGNFVWGGGGGTVQQEQYIWVNDVYMSGR